MWPFRKRRLSKPSDRQLDEAEISALFTSNASTPEWKDMAQAFQAGDEVWERYDLPSDPNIHAGCSYISLERNRVEIARVIQRIY